MPAAPAQTPSPLRTALRRHGGFALLCAFSLLSLARLELQRMPGHYRIFTGAGRALWHSQNPYGTDFGTGVGLYFYSPTCALTVFGPLSLLPEGVGMILYMSVSWALFVWGARQFWRSFGGSPAGLQWFWALITAQLVGGILASKLEIAIAGLLLGSIAILGKSGPRPDGRAAGAAAALALILNWKFQPLPVVGLFLLSWILIRRDLKLPLLIAAALGACYLLPFAFFPRAFVEAIHASWQATFSSFVAESVLNFENLFAFLNGAFGLALSFFATQAVSAGVGLLMAAGLVTAIQRSRAPDRLADATLLSVALGTAYMTALSPLGQNNALILYAPLLLVAILCAERSRRPGRWTALLIVCGGIMIFSYSDLMPAGVREFLRHLSIKPLACLALGGAVALELGFRRAAPGSPLASPPLSG